MLRRVFGCKKDEMTRGWKNVYNVHIRYLYFLSNIIRMINSKRATVQEHIEHKEEMRNQILVEERKWKSLPERSKRRWKHEIKMDHKETRVEGYGTDSAGLGYRILPDCCEHGNETTCYMKDTLTF
jgi:hypothetical protein